MKYKRLNVKTLLLLIALCLAMIGLPESVKAEETIIDVPLFNFVASDFKPEHLAQAKKAGRIFRATYVTYNINAPKAGMYGLYVAAARWESHFLVNGKEVAFCRITDNDLDTTKVKQFTLNQITNVWLKQGSNTLTIQRRTFPSLPYLGAIQLIAKDIPVTRVAIDLPNYRGYYRKGESVAWSVRAQSLPSRDYVIDVSLHFPDGNKRALKQVKVTAGQALVEKTLDLPLDFEGQAILRATVDGQNVMRPASIFAMDVSKQATLPQHVATPKLITEIDCVTQEPTYFGNGKTRVTTHAGMTYRESANQGNYTHGWKQSSWFAYRLDDLDVGKAYHIEVDYPDDKVRTFTVSLVDQPRYGHDDHLIPYPLDSGVASGGEFINTNTMQTMSIDFIARRTEARVLFFNWHGPLSAAAAKIRLYQTDDQYPALELSHKSQRHQAIFFEEYDRWYGYFGALDDSQSELLKAADRYARWCQSAGIDTFWDTVAIYGTTCWPSMVIDNANVRGFLREDHYPTGIIWPLLLTAERYGMRYFAELHPTENMVTLPDEKQMPELYCADARGKLRLNPLHPTVQQWGTDLVTELANHASDSPAFKGISIRWMTWANCGWASFNSPDAGVDDWTLGMFGKQVNIDVSSILKKSHHQRWAWINANHRQAFDNWKNQQLVAYYQKLITAMRQVRSDLKLVIHRFGDSADFGITDRSKLAAIAGVELTYAGQGYPAMRRITDPKMLPGAGSENHITDVDRNGDIVAFSNMYMEVDFMLDQLKLGSKDGQRMRICGVINPPGRQMLKRFALLLQKHPLPRLISDGQLGYVQADLALRREFARAFLPLPEIGYAKLDGDDDPVALWQGECDGQWFMYMVNVSPATIDVKLQSKAQHMTELASGQSMSIQSEMKLPAFAVRSFRLVSPITGLNTQLPSGLREQMQQQLASAKLIVQLPQLDEPRILDISPEDYRLACEQVDDAQNHLKQGHYLAFEKVIRQGYRKEKHAERLTGLARLCVARDQFPVGVYNVDAKYEQMPMDQSVVTDTGEMTVKLIRRVGNLKQVYANALDRATDEQGRVYLLLEDGRIVMQQGNGQYVKTLYAELPADQRRSLTIENGWIMLSGQASKQNIADTGPELLPYAQGPLHALADGGVGFLFDPDGNGAKSAGLYQLAIEHDDPRLVRKVPGYKDACDFALMGSDLVVAGRYQDRQGQLALMKVPMRDTSSKPQWISGTLGKRDGVTAYSLAAAHEPGKLIMRQVSTWARFKLVKLDLASNTTEPLFDVQDHYGMHGHQNIFNLYKQFPPWSLGYSVLRCHNGGYAVLIAPLCTLYRLDDQGRVLWAAGVKAEGTGEKLKWEWPSDIAMDGQGQLWVIDCDTSRVDVLDEYGKRVGHFGQPGRLDDTAVDAFWKPVGIEVLSDKLGVKAVFIADEGNGRVVVLDVK